MPAFCGHIADFDKIFTTAVLEGISALVGQRITIANVSRLESPVQFGDVLILPVSAFGSGQGHSGSKNWGNEEQLVAYVMAKRAWCRLEVV